MITRSKLNNNPSLKSSMVTFAATRNNIREPKAYLTTLKILHWFESMQEEIKASTQNHAWNMVPMPLEAN